jgi:uncharacterized protein (TIGR03435 family)
MWQNLLRERFGVRLHRDSKEFQVEELMVAKGGSKLKETAEDPTASLEAGPPNFRNGVLTGPGMVNTLSPVPNGVKVHTMARAQPLSKLAAGLSNALRRPVLDKTGLAGKYDFDMEYTNPGANLGPPAPPQQGPGPASASPSDNASEPGPDLSAALQQLGLRLVAGKTLLDVLIIDEAERVPTPN